MVQWAKENAVASGLADGNVRWLVDDCLKFVKREIRRGNKYDAIIMDPPSYGRGPSGEIWKIEDSVDELITLTSQLLSNDPLFFLVNSYTTGLSPAAMQYILGLKVVSRYGGKLESEELGLRVSATGLAIPCGASARWYRK
jgi:23S rRNA (cytosine1962-C5)-methyltransferase